MKIRYILECIISSIKETYWNKKFISPFNVHNEHSRAAKEQIEEDLNEYWSRDYH